jgi:phage shock protein C
MRRGRDLGGPSARAACGGNLKPDLVATQGDAAHHRSWHAFPAPSSSPDASTTSSLTDTVSLRPQAPSAKGGAMAQPRKLYRSRTDRKLAGVCGGLAQYLNTDATLIRVLFVVLAVLGGSGIVIYVAMWILVRNEPQDET